MSTRRGFFGLLATAVVAQRVQAVPEPVTPPPPPLEMGELVHWTSGLPQMPSVGRVIGIRSRSVPRGTEPVVSYHIDFGRTNLWVEVDSLRRHK